MPSLSRPRAGYKGEAMATQNPSAPVDLGAGPPMGSRNLRMRDGTVENIPTYPIYIHKLMVTHTDETTAANFFELWDLNGRLFKIYLHSNIFRAVPAIRNRKPPPTFLVPAMDGAFTTKTEIIDFPAPGLLAEGNVGVIAGVNNTTDTTIYYTYARDIGEPEVIGP